MVRSNEFLAAVIGLALAMLGIAASATAESGSTQNLPQYREGWLYIDRDVHNSRAT